MKTLKIIIVVVIVAALGFGIFKIVQNKPEPPKTTTIPVPEGCEGVVASAQQLIETRFNAVKDGEFDKLKSVPEDLRLFFVGQDIESECMVSVNAIIRNRYLLRFIAMAKNEFSGKSWSNWSKIRSMNTEFLKEEKDNSDLKAFKRYCEEYSALAVYYKPIKDQSKQRPSSINDKWNYSNTQTLLSKSEPSANKPVSTTTLYEQTRKEAVKKSLHAGHVAFIDALLEKARENIKNDPTYENYRNVVESVTNNESEIIQYKNNARKIYGVGNDEVTNNFNRWSGIVAGFEKIVVEDAIMDIGNEDNK